jgi:type I restriction enzyme S subunit
MEFGRGNRIVRMVDLYRGDRIDFTSLDRVTYPRPIDGRYHLCAGDILLNRTSVKREGIGKASIVGDVSEPTYFDCSIIRARPDASIIDPRYLIRALNGPCCRPQVLGRAKTATITTITQPDVESVEIPLPPLAEQRRIAEVLERAEALRAKRRAALAQLDSLTQSLFLDLHRNAAAKSRTVPLSDVAEANRGSFVNGPFGSDLLTSELQEEGVPVIYIRDIRNGEYIRVSKSCVTERKARDLAVCSVRSGDVLVAKVGDPPGIAAVYPKGEQVGVVTQDVIRIRVSRDTALAEFVVGYLNSSIGMWKVAGITIEATRARFSLKDFKAMKIEIPPIELQREFARRVAAVEKLKTAQRTSLAELDALFATLQHRAFRGEL